MAPIRVGFIGMQIDRSWSAVAHVPALRAVPRYEIRAVSMTRQESTDAAAAHYGIPHAFAGHEALITSPEVDLVVVTTKVPAHLELVTAALEAGKHVYCEWPLGKGLAEARQMAELARTQGVRTVIGLQARVSPTVSYVRDLVRDGFVGEVLSSSLIGQSMSWGERIEAPNAYLADRRNGATMLSISIGHALNAVCSVLGEMRQVAAILANGRTGHAKTLLQQNQRFTPARRVHLRTHVCLLV
jgi:predicted dehydrogenase